MAVVKRRKQQSVMVIGPGGVAQLHKITVMDVDGENVTLKLEVPAGTIVQTLEEWEQVQAARTNSGDPPKSRAAYSG
jgi:hypothetical protein